MLENEDRILRDLPELILRSALVLTQTCLEGVHRDAGH